MKFKLLIYYFLLFVGILGCNSKQTSTGVDESNTNIIEGCMDTSACNFDPNATSANFSSCLFETDACGICGGSSTSSNTNALVTSINNIGKEAYRVETTSDLKNINLKNKNVAITAGASAPDHMVQNIVDYIKPKNIEFYIDTDETEYFPLPTELRTNIKNLSNFISSMFPENTIKSENGIKNDKRWSATKALASL